MNGRRQIVVMAVALALVVGAVVACSIFLDATGYGHNDPKEDNPGFFVLLNENDDLDGDEENDLVDMDENPDNELLQEQDLLSLDLYRKDGAQGTVTLSATAGATAT